MEPCAANTNSLICKPADEMNTLPTPCSFMFCACWNEPVLKMRCFSAGKSRLNRMVCCYSAESTPSVS